MEYWTAVRCGHIAAVQSTETGTNSFGSKAEDHVMCGSMRRGVKGVAAHLHGALAGCLAGELWEVSGRVVGGQVLVCCRVPLGVVDAVEDAVERVLPAPQQPLHAPAAQRRLDLVRIPCMHMRSSALR